MRWTDTSCSMLAAECSPLAYSSYATHQMPQAMLSPVQLLTASSCVPVKQAPIAAYAFRAEVTKWLALVRLLLSDIPERAELAAPGLATSLQPYFHLTNAVRTGSLATFQWAV